MSHEVPPSTRPSHGFCGSALVPHGSETIAQSGIGGCRGRQTARDNASGGTAAHDHGVETLAGRHRWTFASSSCFCYPPGGVASSRLSRSIAATDLIVEAPGNRRGVGTTNHCSHGPEAILEEVLDWRPFDYYTVRSTMPTPGGPVTFLTTVDFEPTVDGTMVRMRFGPPRTARERAILTEMRPMFEGMLAERGRTLRAQLDSALLVSAAAAAQPDVPMPRSDGLFAEIQPMLMMG